MAAEWEKYTGASEQAAEINNAKHGFKVIFEGGKESDILHSSKGHMLTVITHYLICEPLPHAEMRAEHAMTGRAVENDVGGPGEWMEANPEWAGTVNYRFKKPEKEVIYCRDYLVTYDTNKVIKRTINKHSSDLTLNQIEYCTNFIKWIHTEWQEVEL